MCKSLFILVNGASECKEGEKSRKHAKKTRQKRPEATDELFCDLVCEPSTSPSKNRGQKAAKCTMEGLAKALTWPFSEKQRAEPRQKPWSQLGASAQEPPRSYISASFGRVAAKASHRRRARGRFAGRAGTKEQPKAAENGLAARPEVLAANLPARPSRPRALAYVHSLRFRRLAGLARLALRPFLLRALELGPVRGFALALALRPLLAGGAHALEEDLAAFNGKAVGVRHA